MIIHKIQLENFGVYAGIHSIHLAIGDKNAKPVTLIGGMNGWGKTSILEAVLLALYGDRSPTVRNSGLSYHNYLATLVNRDCEDKAVTAVELVFQVPGKEKLSTLRLRRSWRGKKRSHEWLEVWRDGELDPHLSSGWSTYVEELLPCGLAGLFFFDGEKISLLAEADETPDEVKQAIRAVLGLELVDRLIGHLQLIIRRNKAKLRDTGSKEQFELLEKEQESLLQRLRSCDQEIARLRTLVARYQAKLVNAEEAYTRAGGSLHPNTSLGQEHERLQAEIQAKKMELISAAAGPLPLLLVQPLLASVRKRVSIEDQARQARSAMAIVQEVRDKVVSRLVQVGQDKAKDEVEVVLEAHLAELESAAACESAFPITHVGIAQVNALLEGLSDIRKSASLGIAQLEAMEAKRSQVERHLLVDVDDVDLEAKLAEVRKLTVAIAEAQEQQRFLEHEKKRIEFQLRTVNSRYQKIAAGMNDVDEAERVVKWAARSQETMRQFRDKLTEKKVTTLTAHITEAFRCLTHKTTLVKDIHIEPNTLRILLEDEHGREIVKSRLSSGEKQMLAVAVLWGLGRASGRRLPVIIDTPMGRLDSSHRMKFVAEYLPKASHQVVVLSTDTEIVGDYLEALRPSVGQSYLLKYDEAQLSTSIVEGYFAREEEGRADDTETVQAIAAS